VAITAITTLLELLKFSFDRYGFWISSFLAIAMTTGASIYGNVGRQAAQGAGARDVDMAGGAFHHVFAFAAFMRKFQGDSFRRVYCQERRCRFVTTGAIVRGRFFVFPVTGKAGVMRVRPGFERSIRGRKSVRPRRSDSARVRDVADRTVVVIRFGVVDGTTTKVRGLHESQLTISRSMQRRNRILMFVVRKLDGELPFVFRLHSLIRIVRIAECETASFPWRGADMADRADCRPGADDCLPGEKLLTVTAHAGVMIGKVSHVGKFPFRRPRGWNLMAVTASKALMFFGRVQER
jgi:hypothetical protein